MQNSGINVVDLHRTVLTVNGKVPRNVNVDFFPKSSYNESQSCKIIGGFAKRKNLAQAPGIRME